MSKKAQTLIVGGTSGIGRRLAEILTKRGDAVVVTGRDQTRADQVAGQIGGETKGLALDLCRPTEIAERLAHLPAVRHIVISAIDRDDNKVRQYNIAGALQLVTMKLVGYAAVINALLPKLSEESAIALFGGLAKERPYPGSTTVTTVNGGITSMVRTLAVELAPVRVNAIHPGIVGDSPAWNGKPPAVLEAVRGRTPTGRLATMDDVATATLFLLENASVNGINLNVDGGWLLT